jgi:hypothetical protein
MDTTKSTPRDTFLYLLVVITLIGSAISFGTLAYQLIDLKFPDILNTYIDGTLQTMRIALSSLVVLFPVFFLTSRFLRKDVVAHPEKKDLRVRRWLLHLLVFFAALTVISDLVVLIYNFLQGDLTTPFVLKVLAIFFIAGSTLFYYLSELRERNYPRKVFQWIILLVVILTVGYGFYLAGSPQSQRLIRFDDQKVSHLSMIQDRLIYYWQQKSALPTTLSQLDDPISNFLTPKDPQTGNSYEYSVTGPHSFKLCADFNKTSTGIDRNIAYPVSPTGFNYNWQHDTGHVCFDRNIDPSLYPPITKPTPK